ncbi:MAG TPA: histidine kinase [Casimicrobiaceae bacterium]|nr:histidine kinase [Casimicrobiaceae bacterium]
MSSTQSLRPPFAALSGLRGVSWQSIALILAINFGFAAILWIDSPRPFWHPLITAQCFGLSIAYAVNAARPWEQARPIWRLVIAVAVGTIVGFSLLVVVKIPLLHMYAWQELVDRAGQFAWTAFSGFTNGLFVGLFFLLKFREARARADILRGEADRNLLSKQAIEAQLKLMQAQVEPHFLFNTLASVQFLVETDPPRAGQMLGHLLAYLRTALPQLRSNSSTLGQEVDLAQAYLSIMQMRMGSRLRFSIAVPESLRAAPLAPMLLMSMVENAVRHGIEPKAAGGTIRIEARTEGNSLQVTISDDGQGMAGEIGRGVGLSNLRARLQALYGARARFVLQADPGRGARATIEVPHEAAMAA